MTTKKSKLSVVLSDAHVPFHAPDVAKMTFNFIREQQPDTVHLLGDLADFYSISKFDKDPARRLNLQEELDAVRDWLTELRDAAPKARIIYSEGNHEFRLRKYLMSEAKALAGLRALTLDKLLDFESLKIRFQPSDRPYRFGHLLFTHGEFVSRWSGMSAKRHFERYGCCVIHGHTHRLGAFYHTDISDTFAAFENGCLSTLTPDYVTAPDWQNGFSVVCRSRPMSRLRSPATSGFSTITGSCAAIQPASPTSTNCSTEISYTCSTETLRTMSRWHLGAIMLSQSAGARYADPDPQGRLHFLENDGRTGGRRLAAR